MDRYNGNEEKRTTPIFWGVYLGITAAILTLGALAFLAKLGSLALIGTLISTNLEKIPEGLNKVRTVSTESYRPTTNYQPIYRYNPTWHDQAHPNEYPQEWNSIKSNKKTCWYHRYSKKVYCE